MKKQFPLLITFFNLFTCLLVCMWLLADVTNVAAQNPQSFLGPVFYGSAAVSSIFDHDLPLVHQDGQNHCVQHYDGSACPVNPLYGWGYDAHDGIDYDFSYKPVLAAANGTVSEAGWSIASDHRSGLGLRVQIKHTNGYLTEYGHLSTIVVEKDDQVTLDPEMRRVVIGISGNTGNVMGSGCDAAIVPTCGAHLHFGLINPDGFHVNPYGWIGNSGTDP